MPLAEASAGAVTAKLNQRMAGLNGLISKPRCSEVRTGIFDPAWKGARDGEDELRATVLA